jgi:hypothetical protein
VSGLLSVPENGYYRVAMGNCTVLAAVDFAFNVFSVLSCSWWIEPCGGPGRNDGRIEDAMEV